MRKFFAGALALLVMALAGPAMAQSTSTGLQSTIGRGRFLSLTLSIGNKVATAVAGVATLNKNAGVITTEALTTAAGATYVLTVNSQAVLAGDQVVASLANGTNTAGAPVIMSVTPANNSFVVRIRNIDASAALNGSLKVAFVRFLN